MTLATRTLAGVSVLGFSVWALYVGCGGSPKPLATGGPLPPSAAGARRPGGPPHQQRPRAEFGSELTPELPPNADPDAPLIVNVPIEDASGHALDAFYAALERAQTDRGQARVVVYGASHVAADLYTDIVRSKLQERFGDAGVGFVQPVRAVSGYRSAGVAFESSNGWNTVHVKARTPIEDRYGLAGLYLTPARTRKGARAIFSTRPHAGLSGTADSMEVWYLKQPRGGKLQVIIDGVAHRINTAARRPKPGYAHFKLKDVQHRVELAATGNAPVHLFGLVMERSTPGVVVDNLGIPGSRARYHLLWNDAIYREHLARRKPNLVILAYGTNESGDDDEPIEIYANDLRKVLARVRDTVPEASCLLVGPSDRPIENPDGTFVDRPRTTQIVEVQRIVSAEFGCGFFDMVAFMGGRMSMLRWVNSLPPLGTPDYVHFTRVGYEAFGHALHAALMAGYGPAEAAPLPPTAASLAGNSNAKSK